MKKHLLRYLLLLLLPAAPALAQNVGIGTATPDAAAALDITATGKGLLIPRLDSASRAQIPAPPTGLLVFQTDGRQGFWYYGGGAWLYLPDKSKSGDNLGNHTATQTLALNNNFLSNTPAATGGLRLSDAGFARLGVSGNVSANHRLDLYDNNSGLPGGQGFGLTAYTGTASGYPVFRTLMARGVAGAALPVQRNDRLGALYFYGRLDNGSYYALSGLDTDYLDNGQAGHYASNLCFSSGGYRQMMLDSAGRLGVGTLSPNYRLDVNGTIRAATSQGVVLDAQDRPLITRGWDAFTSGNYQGLGRWGLFMEPFNLTFGVPAMGGRNFSWATYNLDSSIGSQLMGLSQAGFLGIGTTGDATTRLDLVADNSNGGGTDDIILRAYGANAVPGFSLRRHRGTAAAPENVQNGDFLGEIGMGSYYNGTSGNFVQSGLQATYQGDGLSSATDLRLVTSAQERLRIDPTGNVGVGLTAPTARLDVLGSGSGVGIGRVRVRSTNDQAGIGFVAATAGGAASMEAVIYQPQGSNDLRFYVGGVDRVNLSNTGQVGIGKQPGFTEMLDVAGNLRLGTAGVVGEVHTVSTGSSNMLAVAYGQVNTSGTLYSNGNTGNFTVSTISPGHCRLTFTAASGLSTTNFNTMAVAVTRYSATAGSASFVGGVGIIDIYHFNASGTATDNDVAVVVFRP